MAVSEDYVAFINERFEKIPNWAIRKMFGGVGIFREGIMFAMLSDKDKLFLRVDTSSIPDFEAKGMVQFNHKKNTKANMPYYECPLDVLENPSELRIWTDKAYSIAEEAKKKKKK